MLSQRFIPVLLLISFLLTSSAARTQTPKSAEKITLAQANEQFNAKADEVSAELEKQAGKLARTQADAGITNKKSADARAAFLKLSQQRQEAVLNSQSLTALAKRPHDADEMKTLEQWLALAGQTRLPEPEATRDQANDPATDQRVKDTPKEAEESVASLATYLTKGVKSDREKARAIFLWVANNVVYDLAGAAARNTTCEPAAVLRTRSTNCAGYSALYAALARAAGLEVQFVGGNMRMTTVEPLLAPLGTRSPSGCMFMAHAWNAVKIDGTWQLVDTTIACGRIRRGDKIDSSLPTNSFYFCTPPSRLILTHLPTDDQWQLLKTPISKEEQDSLPNVFPAYYDNGLRLVSHTTNQISARKDLVLTFRVPRDVMLMASLLQDDKNVEEEPVLIQRLGDLVDVRVVFPKAGNYVVRISAGKVNSSTKRTALRAIDYLVEAVPGTDRAPRLPAADSMLQEKEGRIYWPLTGTLKAGQMQPFLIYQPGASALIVMAGGQKVKLTPVGNGLFAGNIQPPAGPLTIGYCWTTEPTRIYDVLRFKAE